MKIIIDINAANNHATTALNIACKENNSEVALLLLNHPRIDINKPNSDGVSPLMHACYRNLLVVVKEMLKRDDVDINAGDRFYRTAMHTAIRWQYTEAALLLLRHPLFHIDVEERKSLFRLAIENRLSEVVQELLRRMFNK